MQALLDKHPRAGKDLKYGTAGFRDRADLPLHATFLRMGMFACLRSRSRTGLAAGVMITASHNPEEDNGIKLVDADGGMLSQTWEPLAETLANCSDAHAVISLLQELEKEHVPSAGAGAAPPAVVVLGRDTRAHSAELAACVEAGVRACGGTPLDLGEVTTPQLHWVVAALNASGAPDAAAFDAEKILAAYYSTLSSNYLALRSSASSPEEVDAVVLDCSFGIGSVAAEELLATVQQECAAAAAAAGGKGGQACLLSLDLRNTARTGPVNDGCGAEFVQKGQLVPCGVSVEADARSTMASLDGDADRLVFHTYTAAGAGLKGSNWALLDGDKIACLLAVTLLREMQAAGLDSKFSFGAVQTAYANGAAGDYLRAQGVPVVLAKTGVKFVHHAALAYDVGVYFEANGHGTVLFSPALMTRLSSRNDEPTDGSRAALALQRLRAFTMCINQAVGDALSDMLAALACLRIQNLSLKDWMDLYTDYPSRQLKVQVSNKHLISCSADETTALTPAILPVRLSEAMQRAGKCARAFVRPSGTEDVVRVYAEAASQAAADALAADCIQAIHEALGGM